LISSHRQFSRNILFFIYKGAQDTERRQKKKKRKKQNKTKQKQTNKSKQKTTTKNTTQELKR
jgi:hypothetical protein